MNLRCVAALLLVACAGCSSEGGITGSGISSVSGTVSDVQSPDTQGGISRRMAALTAAATAGVRVRIVEAPTVETVTDADGTFALSGDFAGRVTLQFDAPGAPAATLGIDVPAGSTVILPDVVLRGATPQLQQPIRQRDFLATIIMRDCNPDGSGELVVADAARRANQFVVRITSQGTERDTAILDQATDLAVTCDSLQPGQHISVEGAVQQGAIVADTIAVSPAAPRLVPLGDATVGGTVLRPGSGGHPQSPIADLTVRIVDVPGLSTVTNALGEFVLEGSFSGSLSLRFELPGGAADVPLNVPAGATVVLRNAVLRAGQIVPRIVRVRGFRGALAELPDCAAAVKSLGVDDAAQPPHRFTVRVGPETLLLHRAAGGPVPATCRGLRPGVIVVVDGVVDPDGALAADTVIVSGP